MRRACALAFTVLLAVAAGWGIVSTGQGVLAFGDQTLGVLWLVAPFTVLNLFQLFLSAQAWKPLLPPGPSLSWLYRLRILREGIDSMLPVAQVGGEAVAAHMLSQRGLTLAAAGASVVVDVTLEFLTQLIFLLLGIVALALISPTGTWQTWAGAALLTAAALGGMVAAQRFGILLIMEALARRIAALWPAIGDLRGLDAAAAAVYRRPGALLHGGVLHLLGWLLGCVEAWGVLWALGLHVSPTEALIVEALGMAARSAGFAIPGALVVQETGFALAAVSVGLPDTAGLCLSLIKRAREVVVGVIGLALWWWERRATQFGHDRS
jgi:putative membrane protein